MVKESLAMQDCVLSLTLRNFIIFVPGKIPEANMLGIAGQDLFNIDIKSI